MRTTTATTITTTTSSNICNSQKYERGEGGGQLKTIPKTKLFQSNDRRKSASNVLPFFCAFYIYCSFVVQFEIAHTPRGRALMPRHCSYAPCAEAAVHHLFAPLAHLNACFVFHLVVVVVYVVGVAS